MLRCINGSIKGCEKLIKLIKFLRPYKKQCIVGPLFKLFEAILELLLPTVMALVINNGVINSDKSYVLKMGGLMLFMAVLGFCSSMVCQTYACYASQGVGTDLRNTLFKHISELSYKEIDEFGPESLINRVTNDVNQLQWAVAMLIRLVVRAPFIWIGAITMAIILDFKLSLILIGTTPFFAIILYIYITKSSPIYIKYQSQLDKISLRVRENLGGVRVIRAFGGTKFEEERFKEKNDELTEIGIKLARFSAILNPMTSLIMNFSIIILLWVGGVHINAGSLNAGTIIAFINYVTQVLYASIVLSNLIVLFTKAQASAVRVNEVLETTSSIKEKETTEVLKESGNYKIQFKNVSFRYNETGDNALQNINISIKKGETIGIIGGTGSGKTTFISLIGRFYDASSGQILIDGIDIKDYTLKDLRSKISIVAQKIELFTGTIKENLLWAKKDASDTEIIKAAKTAEAYEFISKLKNGFETAVERGGNNFSGGQKQRLTIARAILKDPDIFILDDSSSALDFQTDTNLRRNIKENSIDMTVIIVSQRATSIKDCDKIIVFDDGNIASVGKHEELIEICDIYKEIYNSQNPSKEAV